MAETTYMVVDETFVLFKQKTAYEMRISDWSSDVCSSDLGATVQNSRPQRSAIRSSSATQLASVPSTKTRTMPAATASPMSRSAERRVGKECVSTCTSRSPPYN